MTLWQRIARNPVAVVGLGTALYGVLVAFGVLELTAEQTGALTTLAGAAFFALRWFVTPSSEVIVQQKTDDAPPVAGAGLGGYETGQALDVNISPAPPADLDVQPSSTPEDGNPHRY